MLYMIHSKNKGISEPLTQFPAETVTEIPPLISTVSVYCFALSIFSTKS